jgi:hypothetical protein
LIEMITTAAQSLVTTIQSKIFKFFFFLMISKDVKQYVFIFQIETITWNFYLEGRGGVRVESKVI